jgi:hypothetical protein
MRISVIVPVYNKEKTVAQVLEKLSQTSLNLEVIQVPRKIPENHQIIERDIFTSFFGKS